MSHQLQCGEKNVSEQTVYYHVHFQLYGKTREHLYLNLETTSLQIII
jgi:hypothetical protein